MLTVKTIFQFLIVLLSIYSCSAQNSRTPGSPCDLTLKDSPVLEGYSLGMDITGLDPKAISRKAEYSREDYIKAETTDSTYYLTFENKKLRMITVLYRSLKFNDLEAFVAHLNKKLNLPNAWEKQTDEQIEIEKEVPELEQKLTTMVALRDMMLQIHGKNCREAKKIGREIPALVRTRALLDEKRQIGSRLECNGFSIISFIDNSIEKGVPAIHLYIPVKENALNHGK